MICFCNIWKELVNQVHQQAVQRDSSIVFVVEIEVVGFEVEWIEIVIFIVVVGFVVVVFYLNIMLFKSS
jgi:hypothetical protein